ncbi:MAG: response regulator, partial [Chitinivibrionales bacterium]
MNGDIYKELSVWVVDDEPGMCRGAERTLRDQVVRLEDVEEEIIFRVTSINTGNEFLKRIDKECPSIVLLDKKLPDADGIDLLAEISERKLPVIPIVITAYASLEKAVKATKLGAYDFLAKPFTPDELRYSVKKAARNVILTEKARQLEKEKKQVRFQFISVLAHEMKSPLNAIEGYTDLIYNKRAGDNIDAYLEMVKRIDHRITGMRKLIADLLDLTSLESGKKQRDIQELNVREIADDVVEGNTERARDKGVEISLECRD